MKIIVLPIVLALTQGLLETAAVVTALVVGAAYSLPPVRLKRFPLAAALCISGVRSAVVNLGMYGHFALVFGGALTIAPSVWALTAFVLPFSFAIAVLKDVPDMEGDRRYRIATFTVRLGPQRWPTLPARVLGPFALAWWATTLRPRRELVVAPDALRARATLRGLARGARARRVAGAGAELHQLRDYAPGDPLARIDWKATARTGALVTREYSEDQHLDVLVAIDAGRLSRLRCGELDRFGLYSNVAARFAEIVTHHDDRIGLVVYADRVLATCPPARGLAAVIRMRRALESLSVQPAESDPTAAAVSVRALLKHRALVLLLTDLDDASVAHQLVRAVRLLAPPHLVVVAGIQSGEIAALARREARDWQDPFVALAASEHQARAARQRALLRRLGAPVVAAPAQRLEQELFERYEALRRSRRI